MRRYVNKSEVMLTLERGGRVEGIRSEWHFLIDATGEHVGLIRYSLWRILTSKHIKHVRNERHGHTPVAIWTLRDKEPTPTPKEKKKSPAKPR